MLLPLLVYPYLIRALGKETYGLVVFAQAIIGYLVILVGFGFNISATKEVSIHRDDKNKLSEIVSSVLLIKGGLFLLSMVILSTLVFFIPQAGEYKALFFLTTWMCLYDVIFPVWYFQGIEQMKYITYITLVSRLTFLALIFVLIHIPGDYLFVPIINGIGALLAGITSLVIIFGNHRIKFALQPYGRLRHYFIDSIPIFVSNVSIRVYLSTNKVVIGAFLGMSEVAYYDLAEKIINALKIPQHILGQALFPKINKEKNICFIKKIFKPSLIGNVVIFLLVLLCSKQIVLFLGGYQMLDAIGVVNILSVTIPVVAISNVLGIQLLIPFGFSKEFSRAIFTSGFFYLFQLWFLWVSSWLSINSISVVNVVTEVFVAIYLFYFSKKFQLLNQHITDRR